MKTDKFDKSAFTYDCKPMHVERAKAVADGIKRAVKLEKDWVMADFGCGTGLLGFQFIDDVKRVDMIDVSDNMLRVLREKIKEAQVKNMNPVKLDIFSDKLPVNVYDMIVTLMTFHHIEDIEEVVFRLNSMLKQGGFLCIADLDEEDGSYHLDGDTVHNGINQEMLQKIASDAGLYLIEKSVPYIIRKKVDKTDREYPVFLHVYKKGGGHE